MLSFGGASSKTSARHPQDVALIEALQQVQALVWLAVDGTILDANENFCAIVGYPRSELLGQSNAVLHPQDSEPSRHDTQLWNDLSDVLQQDGQYRGRRKDGAQFWIQANLFPIRDAQNQVTKVVVFATDITARRRIIDAILSVFRANSAGDQTTRIPPVARGGELAEIARQANAGLDRQERLIKIITRLSQQLGQTSADMAEHASDTAHLNAEQAQGLTETLAAVRSVETLIATARERLMLSHQASHMANDKSREGQDVVQEAGAVMARIKDGSARIENIVSVIDGIAFQTNLLSLNASVEAARAGEAGRGFAVVAQEVRSLAQETAREAAEIRGLIRQSVDDIAQGVDVVDRVGAVLAEIGQSIRDISEQDGSVAETCDAQVQGIAQAVAALSALEDTGRHASKGAHSAAKSVSALAERADELGGFLDQFVGKAERHPPIRAVS